VRGLVAGGIVVGLLALGMPVAAAAQSDVDRARARANAAAAALAKAETRLAVVQRDLAAVEARRHDAATRLAALEDSLRATALSQFIRGTRSTAGFGVDLADASASVRARALRSIIAAGSAEAAEAYRVAAGDLEEQETRLAALQKSSAAALASYRKQRVAVDAELRRLVAIDKERVAAAKRAVSRPTGGATVIGSGAWICPVQGPRAFSDDYGDARAGGRRHQGNDILAPRGTPVVAPVAGSASQHDNNLGGHAFYLHGVDGVTYYGAHLDSYTSNYGNVAAGTVLGYVGNTGDARNGPPHLHFEIHPGGGRDIDPYPTLRRYC
jgi:murein DD-endopeptidase MepM/ murein hydrolase activator NlpD